MRGWAIVFLIGCGPSANERVVLRDDARKVLSAHCGSCHESHLQTAISGALAIFDLDEPEWAARMSNLQLSNAHWRLDQPLPPDGRASDATDQERARFQRYVAAETAARTKAPACPPRELVESLREAVDRARHDSLDAGREVLTRAASLIPGPLDENTRHALARLAYALSGGADPQGVLEEVDADVAEWNCTPAG